MCYVRLGKELHVTKKELTNNLKKKLQPTLLKVVTYVKLSKLNLSNPN